MAGIILPGTQSMSTKTVANILEEARSLLNEESAAFWNQDELLVWVNDAINVISGQAQPLGATVNITIAAETLEYDLAALVPSVSVVQAVAAIYQPGSSSEMKGLEEKGPHEIGTSVTAGDVPNYYYLFDGKIGLWPVQAAGASGVGKTVRVYLSEMAASVSNTTDTIPLPCIYDPVVKAYVVAMALLKDRKGDEAQAYLNIFDAHVGLYGTYHQAQGEDGP